MQNLLHMTLSSILSIFDVMGGCHFTSVWKCSKWRWFFFWPWKKFIADIVLWYLHIFIFMNFMTTLRNLCFFFWLIHFFHLIWLPKTLWQMAALHISKYIYHSVKSGQIRSYFWSVFSCIRIRNNSVFGHFSSSIYLFIFISTYPSIYPWNYYSFMIWVYVYINLLFSFLTLNM